MSHIEEMETWARRTLEVAGVGSVEVGPSRTSTMARAGRIRLDIHPNHGDGYTIHASGIGCSVSLEGDLTPLTTVTTLEGLAEAMSARAADLNDLATTLSYASARLDRRIEDDIDRRQRG